MFSYFYSSVITSSLSSSSKICVPYFGTPPETSSLYYLSIYSHKVENEGSTSFSSVGAYHTSRLNFSYDFENSMIVISFTDEQLEAISSVLSLYGAFQLFFIHAQYTSSGRYGLSLNFPLLGINNGDSYNVRFGRSYLTDVTVVSVKDATDSIFMSKNPFVVQAGSSVPDIPVNALPFRAYEMVCNYYYRNELNNPYILDGEPQYNKFIPTTDGGPDENLYNFHFKNWELDKFTSAVPSPQFGEAPLVGMTYRVGADVDTATFNFEDSEGNTYSADLGVDSDTSKIISIANVSDEMPSGNLRQLRQLVDAGISINDFRTVNSFQRFLENTLRRGLRYRNQLLSHAGVSVDYPDIDVPQYIGGFSGYLDSSRTMSTAQTDYANVGDFVGQLGGAISSSREIDCYCPEHGFIIGVYYLEPTPVYTQSLNPVLTKLHPFDYFQQEFGKIGHVPIHMSEVAPLQVAASDDVSQDDVFGYQRAWYDYMQTLDEAHGDFRTTLKNWMLTRTFDAPPTLMEDFVRIKPEQLNNIWINKNIADDYGSNAKFLCDASFKITAVRPIPRYGVPSLE